MEDERWWKEQIVRASDDVVSGHSGILTTYLMDFARRMVVETGARMTPAS